MSEKKRWGDRSDGIWLRDLPALNQLMPGMMPNRCDNEAYITVDVDLRPLDAYLAKVNEGRTDDKYTYFHIISAAIAKAFILRPRMNRFIVNGKIFQRRNVTLAFVVKKKFEDRSSEGLAVVEFEPTQTLAGFHEKVMKEINMTRHADSSHNADATMNIFTRMPHWIMRLAVWLTVFLDKYGKAPKAVTSADPNHQAIFLTNLGSIGLEGGYHHLANWGTNSCFVVLGKKHMAMEYDKQGNGDLREVIPLGITLDERIADGYYYSGTVALVKELLAHPELLELPANTEVEYSIKR